MTKVVAEVATGPPLVRADESARSFPAVSLIEPVDKSHRLVKMIGLVLARRFQWLLQEHLI